MKIFDVFLLNNEIDLLEMRMNILEDYVDYFVITEGDKTFSGLPKKSYYLENIDRFEKWKNKIVHNLISIPDFSITWDREIFSRNSAMSLSIFEDDDIILTSDLDEIPNPNILLDIKNLIDDDKHYTFKQKCYTYYLNNF